ncbi:MAG: HlyD family efflux transporter periplasmic adaptor subunit [Bryobacteraceae bacterium]
MARTVRLSGVTAAKNFATVAAPRMRGPDSGRELILTFLADSGAWVKKGHLIAEIDAQAIKDHVDDIMSQVVQADADIRKRQAEQSVEWENLQLTLTNAKAALDKAKLDAGASEIRTEIDAELLKLTLEEADAQYNQLQKDLANKRVANQAEIRILEITRERHQRHHDRHAIDVTRFSFRAPIDGLVVMESARRSGEMAQIQSGDQISPGQRFMKIVNINEMLVEATANQVVSERLRIGQPVKVSLDAFPEVQLEGRVQSIGAMGVSGWRQNFYIRNIPVRIAISASDPRVIPDLSASADVIIESAQAAAIVPLGAVKSRNGKPVVYVKNGQGFAPVEVTLGAGNNTHVAVVSGLQEGQEIALNYQAASL